MQYRRLGTSGLQLSALSFGAWVTFGNQVGRSAARELIAGRSVGRTRLYQLNPRYFAAAALFAYLSRLAEPADPLKERVAGLRRRPRRTAGSCR